MGLDMYAYVAGRKGQANEYWENYDGATDTSPVEKPREIAYWRKHPNLHGWMHRLWHERGGRGDFNGDELELTWEDLDRLEHDINEGTVAQLETTGFFFGDPSDDYYREQDLQFIREARAELFTGLKVFYNSSW
jgi:hypothetical protein